MSKRLQNRISRISSRKSAENFLSRKSAGKNSASRISAEKNVSVGVWPQKNRLWGAFGVASVNNNSIP